MSDDSAEPVETADTESGASAPVADEAAGATPPDDADGAISVEPAVHA